MKLYHILLLLLLLFAASCSKSTTPTPASVTSGVSLGGVMNVKLSSAVPFSYSITEADVSNPTNFTINQSSAGTTSVDYSFNPVIGQQVQVTATIPLGSYLNTIINYDQVVLPFTTFSTTAVTTIQFTYIATK